MQKVTPCTRCHEPTALYEKVGHGRDYKQLVWAAAGLVAFVVFTVWQADALDSPERPPGWMIGVLFGLMVLIGLTTWTGLKKQSVIRCTNCGKITYVFLAPP